MDHISNETLKERLITEHNNIQEINQMTRELIRRMQVSNDEGLSETEWNAEILRLERLLKENDELGKVIYNQLERDFNYRVKTVM